MKPVKTLGKTTKRYSVIFMCCDPPVPVGDANTNSLARARTIFETTLESERAAIKDSGVSGGEWTLVLYEHTPESRVRVFTADDPDYGGRFVHSVIYEGSREVSKTSYMDYLAGESEEGDGGEGKMAA